MHTHKLILLVINVIGGVAVLGSYAQGILANPGSVDGLWGDVPEAWLPLYSASMLCATAGYFLFAHFLFRTVDAGEARIGGRLPYSALHGIFLLILAPSALWMPLTFQMLAAPSAGLWALIRAVLALVGVGSLALVAAIAGLRPPPGGAGRVSWALALVGSLAFAFQTAVLDAVVWPAHFPVGPG